MNGMQLIRDLIDRALKQLDLPPVDFGVEHPKDEAHGDYASNIALAMFSKSQAPSTNNQTELKNTTLQRYKNPRELAGMIVEVMQKDAQVESLIQRIEVEGPGFINFWLREEWLVKELQRATGPDYGRHKTGNGKLAIVEYSSPNIAKPFTIGHLRSTVIGDAVANLLEANGWKVLRDNHLGDWGTQFGKQIAAIKKWGEPNKKTYTVKELVELYVRFHKEAEVDPTLEDVARAWFKKLEDGDSEARTLWQMCVESSWVEFARIYKLLGVQHSHEFESGRGLGESFFEDKMLPVIETLREKGLLQVGKEGAQLVFFPNDLYPPAMILKKDGATLYHTRDLATDKYRLDTYHPDLVINEVGAEQELYFQQLYAMEEMLGWYSPGQRVHVMHGMFRFAEGKMSTRKGKVVWLEDVLREALERAKSLGKGKMSVSKQVGIGALKWNDLKGEAKRDIVFDWEAILNMRGNSGPFVQYAYARARSILKKSKIELDQISNIPLHHLGGEELALLRFLYRYPEVVADAAESYAPHLVATYVYELSQRFNTFYQVCRVEENGQVNLLRYLLTWASANVIKSGLELLGIEAPEEM